MGQRLGRTRSCEDTDVDDFPVGKKQDPPGHLGGGRGRWVLFSVPGSLDKETNHRLTGGPSVSSLLGGTHNGRVVHTARRPHRFQGLFYTPV